MPPEAGVRGIRVSGLEKSYRRPSSGPIRVLSQLDLAAEGGEIVAIRGASGSGKSTLLHVLGGMLHPDAGELSIHGVSPWLLSAERRADWRNSQVGFIFQSHHLLGELTALENVRLPTWVGGGSAARGSDEAEDLLARLGLAGRLHHLPSELSGGEAQRVAVARALVRRPGLVLADEPTGNLDPETGRRVFEEFLMLQRELGLTALLATHDLELAARCDRVLELRDGRLQPWRGPSGM